MWPVMTAEHGSTVKLIFKATADLNASPHQLTAQLLLCLTCPTRSASSTTAPFCICLFAAKYNWLRSLWLQRSYPVNSHVNTVWLYTVPLNSDTLLLYVLVILILWNYLFGCDESDSSLSPPSRCRPPKSPLSGEQNRWEFYPPSFLALHLVLCNCTSAFGFYVGGFVRTKELAETPLWIPEVPECSVLLKNMVFITFPFVWTECVQTYLLL